MEGKLPNGRNTNDFGHWENFGGEKIWPAPQGWDSPGMWPGPPDPVLDGGEYKFSIRNAQFSMESETDPVTKLQVQRVIELDEDLPEIRMKASLVNKGNSTQKWSVWPVAQLNTNDILSDNRYVITSPIWRNSKYKEGYKIIHGLVNNPQIGKGRSGNFELCYQYLVGKIGLDNREGWVAYSDKRSGKVAVFLFDYIENEKYPDNTSVQIWTQGRGVIYSRGEIRQYDYNSDVTPPYLEIELLSPLQRITPGERIDFKYRLRTCSLPAGNVVNAVNEIGVISQELSMEYDNGAYHFEGSFGVFYEGLLHLEIIDINGNLLYSRFLKKVCPDQGVLINTKVDEKELVIESCILLLLKVYP